MVFEIHQHSNHLLEKLLGEGPCCIIIDQKRMQELVVAMGWPALEWSAYLGF